MNKKITALIVALMASIMFMAVPQTAGATAFGWKWNKVVHVFDGTTSSPNNWKISEAAREWDVKSGVVIRMTTNQAEAEIVVTEVNTTCGVGCAYYPPTSNRVAYGQCRIELTRLFANYKMAEYIALHEMGHCLGLAHAPIGERSVMLAGTKIQFYIPTSYDYKDMKRLYGRG